MDDILLVRSGLVAEPVSEFLLAPTLPAPLWAGRTEKGRQSTDLALGTAQPHNWLRLLRHWPTRNLLVNRTLYDAEPTLWVHARVV
jgi:hypothetical protein